MFDNGKETPTYPGYIYGIRAFAVQRKDAQVTSPQQVDYLWDSGTNHARCSTYEHGYKTLRRGLPHRVAMSGCYCGFYAYFDPEHAYSYFPGYENPGVLGIIKAHGRVTAGDAGFRAEQAEIVCFIRERQKDDREIKEPKPPKARKLWWVIGAQIVALVAGVTMTVVGIIQDWALWACLTPVAVTLGGIYGGNLYARRALRQFQEALAQWNDDMRDWRKMKNYERNFALQNYIDHHIEKALRKKHPEIPIYHSVEEALRDFPVTPLEEAREKIS